jgi:hypothetical protein
MRLPILRIDRREYMLVPKAEYQNWRKKARPSKRSNGRKSAKNAAPEIYTDERVAEFLLSNSADAKDYARACKLVRKMGLDPAKIDHDRPVGVE